MIDERERRLIIKTQDKLCPKLACKDCAVKDGDVGTLLDTSRIRQTKCKFYLEYPDGYAGGYIMEGGKYIRKMNITTCPRIAVWCTDCPKSKRGRQCLEMECAVAEIMSGKECDGTKHK